MNVTNRTPSGVEIVEILPAAEGGSGDTYWIVKELEYVEGKGERRIYEIHQLVASIPGSFSERRVAILSSILPQMSEVVAATRC